MNVTASKLMLGVSLAALSYLSWDHLFPEKAPATAPVSKGSQITAGMVNHMTVLKLERDPFNSVPLGMTLMAESAMPHEAGKDLGELNLQAVMVMFGRRCAVINGQTIHEGQMMRTATGATIRAKRITPSYAIVEGGGRVVMLKVNDGSDTTTVKTTPKNSNPSAGGLAKTVVAGSNPQQR